MFVTPRQIPAGSITDSTAQGSHSLLTPGFVEQFFAADLKSLAESLQTPKHLATPADWFSDSWLVDAWLAEMGLDSSPVSRF
jgi:hypothetical protein